MHRRFILYTYFGATKNFPALRRKKERRIMQRSSRFEITAMPFSGNG
jgi:hypothetical protein